MTQKEKKELLTKDLGGRLLYGVICKTSIGDYKLLGIDDDLIHLDAPVYEVGDDYFHFYEDIKPYLRPMTSMTDEEFKTYKYFFDEDGLFDCSVDVYVDWLLSCHFDFRGLIKRGLAIEAPEDMYI